MAPPSSHRRPPKSRALLIAVAVGAVALLASVIVAFRPGGHSDAGSGTAVSVADSSSSAAVTSSSPAATRKPSASASPTPSASKKKSATPKATASKRPKATSTPKAPSGTGSLAGRIKPGVTYSGVATFYDAGNGDGACTFGPAGDVMTAAMNTADYESSKACGAYVQVRAASGASITVRITNECPAPCRVGQLDLSAQAFAKLAAPVKGEIPITWSLVSPGTTDTLSVRYKTGSSRYWCGIQVLGHRNPVARLEVRTSGGWTVLPRAEYNYFLSEAGAGCGGAIRVTDIYGEQLTVDGIALRPNVVQGTSLQFARH
ncbi:expansin EXLX1 family cellulose-binding protein [Streptomyces sp. NBC_00663]|uniref:expansin EXLX1 family cellulose-binding protein n=1 Tax=Streptomyces sp. NBC_00663 TaxID=2975801 RepID=UPI002E350302|nr:expansin EXLX1 family cellulose-binding protein [Streptomyces sp. NBC_00663]